MEFRDRVHGCLTGGAVGDALGAPVEFLSWPEIQQRYGPSGITTLAPGARFTDDTQMTLFTAEGLIRASVRYRSRGISHPPSVVRHAYLRWLHTQGVPWAQAGQTFADSLPSGWLVRDRRLHRREAPGTTCLSALSAGGEGTTAVPINNSKGCGGVMRVAPVGLVYRDEHGCYDEACEIAAITHGHPDGWHAAGALAVIVHALRNAATLDEAVAAAEDRTSPSIQRVLENARTVAADGLPDAPTIERKLGAGWVADEALAIAVCCALAAPDFRSGVIAAANHSGDTDSTAAICGNILGTHFGRSAIPIAWSDNLDALDLVTAIADDLTVEVQDPPTDPDGSVPGSWWERYPGM